MIDVVITMVIARAVRDLPVVVAIIMMTTSTCPMRVALHLPGIPLAVAGVIVTERRTGSGTLTPRGARPRRSTSGWPAKGGLAHCHRVAGGGGGKSLIMGPGCADRVNL